MVACHIYERMVTHCMNQYGLFEDAIRKECIVTPLTSSLKKESLLVILVGRFEVYFGLENKENRTQRSISASAPETRPRLGS